MEICNISRVAIQFCGLDRRAETIVMCVCLSVFCSTLMQLLLWQGCPTLNQFLTVYQGVTVISQLLALDTILVSAILCE